MNGKIMASINFEKAIDNCVNSLKNKPLKVSEADKDIFCLSYTKFKIFVYYSSYEYEIGFNYFANGKYTGLEEVFFALGCGAEELPKFTMTSNQTVAEEYINSYFNLIDKYYDGLLDTKAIEKYFKTQQ